MRRSPRCSTDNASVGPRHPWVSEPRGIVATSAKRRAGIGVNGLEDMPWTHVPTGWPIASAALMSNAKARCLRALAADEHRPVHLHLIDYYDTDSNHAGASFVDLDPADPLDVTAGDLLGVSMLGTPTPPLAVRRLLNHCGHRLDVLNALQTMPDRELYMADEQTLVQMDRLTEAVLRCVHEGATDEAEAWAFAVALCARKRPDLFPVVDPGAGVFLGLGSSPDHRITWQVMRHVLGDREVLSRVDGLKVTMEREPSARVRVESSRLRLLFAAVAAHISGLSL